MEILLKTSSDEIVNMHLICWRDGEHVGHGGRKFVTEIVWTLLIAESWNYFELFTFLKVSSKKRLNSPDFQFISLKIHFENNQKIRVYSLWIL